MYNTNDLLQYIRSNSPILSNTNFLLYADDLKLFRTIQGVEDARRMQEDLVRLERWCVNNGMQLHTDKCVVLSASRSRSPVNCSYYLQGVVLREVHEVIDLGVCITPCFDFRPHYTRCVKKAMRAVGFISRFARQFKKIETLRLLYVALVRPHVEYASIIWSPRHTKYIRAIESVQHKFLRFALRTQGNPMDRTDHRLSARYFHPLG